MQAWLCLPLVALICREGLKALCPAMPEPPRNSPVCADLWGTCSWQKRPWVCLTSDQHSTLVRYEALGGIINQRQLQKLDSPSTQ